MLHSKVGSNEPRKNLSTSPPTSKPSATNSFPVLASQILTASRSRYHWLVVRNSEGGFESYWTPIQEAEIIRHIRRLLSHPNIRIIGQNFIYDTQFIQHWFGVTPRLSHDTMLAQNVVFPGTPKDLGYLSSLYCQYHWYWKERC